MNAIIRSVAVSLVTLGTSGLLALANAQVPVDDDGRAMADYERTILQALEEVENAMVAFEQEKERLEDLHNSVMAAQKSVELVRELYENGLTDFQNVLDMERSLFLEDDTLTLSQGQVVQDAIRIYKALGGGWNVQAPYLGPVLTINEISPEPGHDEQDKASKDFASP